MRGRSSFGWGSRVLGLGFGFWLFLFVHNYVIGTVGPNVFNQCSVNNIKFILCIQILLSTLVVEFPISPTLYFLTCMVR